MQIQSELRWFVKGAFRILANLFFLCLCLGICFSVLMSDRVSKRPVNVESLDRMHFFVVCQNMPQIIASKELEKYINEPDCNFSIPVDQVSYWNRELKKTNGANSLTSWTLVVKQLTEKKQEVQILFSSRNTRIVSWYEVEDRKVIPQYIKGISIGHSFIAVMLGGALWLFCSWIVGKLYRKFRAKESKHL